MTRLYSDCEALQVPLVVALDRRGLGRVLGKRVRVSVVGIISYDGANELFKVCPRSVWLCNRRRVWWMHRALRAHGMPASTLARTSDFPLIFLKLTSCYPTSFFCILFDYYLLLLLIIIYFQSLYAQNKCNFDFECEGNVFIIMHNNAETTHKTRTGKNLRSTGDIKFLRTNDTSYTCF